MALKAPRQIWQDDITLTAGSVQTRGVFLCHVNAGSGVALGASAGSADVQANPSGFRVAGVLLNDVVNVDQTRYHRNFHKDETMVNERCRLGKVCRVTTDQLAAGQTPNPGDPAYLTANGQVTPTLSATGGLVATPKVGNFAGKKDENGFVTVDVLLPQ